MKQMEKVLAWLEAENLVYELDYQILIRKHFLTSVTIITYINKTSYTMITIYFLFVLKIKPYQPKQKCFRNPKIL